MDCGKFPVLWPEYLASVANGLINSPKISDLTNRDVFQLYLFQNHEKVR